MCRPRVLVLDKPRARDAVVPLDQFTEGDAKKGRLGEYVYCTCTCTVRVRRTLSGQLVVVDEDDYLVGYR